MGKIDSNLLELFFLSIFFFLLQQRKWLIFLLSDDLHAKSIISCALYRTVGLGINLAALFQKADEKAFMFQMS